MPVAQFEKRVAKTVAIAVAPVEGSKEASSPKGHRGHRRVGLLHPVVVRPDGLLIAGERRLVACRQLGWSDVPVTEVDLEQVARGELAENADRKDFLPSEIDAIRKAVAPIEEAAAKERMSEGGKGAKVSQPSRAVDKVGAFAGISGRTVEKIAKVVEAAERPSRSRCSEPVLPGAVVGGDDHCEDREPEGGDGAGKG